MKVLYIFIMAGVVLSGCSSSNNNSSAEDTTIAAKDTMWTVLFDGKTTNGWHTYGKTEAGKAWKADGGMLHLDATVKNDWQTKNGGDLLTNEEYENYQFSAEWKISKAGNSGIIFNVHEDPKKYHYAWHTGIESQIADNAANEDGQIMKHHAGDLYDLISASKDVIKPAGEWNKTVIIVTSGILNIFVNDEQVISTKLWDNEWKNLVKDSKFEAYPDFATYRKGRIALQDHGVDVWFRDIKIKRL